jgi:hypothetical protein
MHQMTGYFRSTSENISFTEKGTHIDISDEIRHSLSLFFLWSKISENTVFGLRV